MVKICDRIENSWRKNSSLLCVGLDPQIDKLPQFVQSEKDPLWLFCRAIIDSTVESVCAFKANIAFFSAVRAEATLEKVITYIRTHYPDILIILDAKRGDVGHTAKAYAQEVFTRYQADLVTINPFMGQDTIKPFLEREDKGAFVLCRTSNPGGGEIQEALIDGIPLYQYVAKIANSELNGRQNIGLVTGATNPNELGSIREIAPSLPFLVPGIGEQGGDLAGVLSKGLTANGKGLIINVSRSIIFADNGRNFAEIAGDCARKFAKEINHCIDKIKA